MLGWLFWHPTYCLLPIVLLRMPCTFSFILSRVRFFAISLQPFKAPVLCLGWRPKGAKPRMIYWFRTHLRLHDSPALEAALNLNPEVFLSNMDLGPSLCLPRSCWVPIDGSSGKQLLLCYRSIAVNTTCCCKIQLNLPTEQTANMTFLPPSRSTIRSRGCTSFVKRLGRSRQSYSSYGKLCTFCSRMTQTHTPTIAMQQS